MHTDRTSSPSLGFARPGGPPSRFPVPVDAALRAAARATATLEQTGNLSANVIVGQVRATATDLLRGLGLSSDEAIARVRSARDELAI